MDIIKFRLVRFFLFILIFLTNCDTQKILDPKQYLFKYGHLTSLDHIDDNVMQKATKEFQKSVGLPETGQLDVKTKTMMIMPRCGREKAEPIINPGSEYTWKKNMLTYTVKNTTDSLSASELQQILKTVINLWTENVNIIINESSTDSKADFKIHFKKIDGKLESLGYAYFPEDGNIFLDVDEDLSLNPRLSSPKIFAGWLFAHELGHALGLSHANTETSVMFPMYNTETLGPSMVDKNNLVALYGGKSSLSNAIICQKMSVDAMLYINKNHILVKDEHYWTFTEEGLTGGPFLLQELLTSAVPSRIDAAFSNGDLVFLFKNHVFLKFKIRKFFKKKTIAVGFDQLPSNIDAALYHSNGLSLHVFKGYKYYMLDLTKKSGQRLVVDGANITEYWSGLPEDLEAATMLDGNRALFIKKSQSFVVDMENKTVIEEKNTATDLFKCSASN